MRIGIYALAKDEAANVERWEESCRDADVRVVTDTGSTDGTQAMLSDRGVTVVAGCPIPWRWDDAHNLSLMHIPADVDVCIRLDLDEVLDPGWRDGVEKSWIADTTKLRYWYQWSEKMRFRSDRIHSRHGYRWQGATHEGLVRWSGDEVQTFTDAVTIRHFREPGKTHKSDLTLLRQAVRENPLDARMHWYLARELDYADDPETAEQAHRYLRMQGGAATERAYAWRILAKREPEKSKRHLFAAMLETTEPESPFAFARMANDMGDHVAALYHARHCVAAPVDGMTHASDPAAYGPLAAYIGSSAARELGRMEEALALAREAARRAPDDRALAANVAVLERLVTEDGPKPE